MPALKSILLKHGKNTQEVVLTELQTRCKLFVAQSKEVGVNINVKHRVSYIFYHNMT